MFIRSGSIIITFNNDQGICILSRVFNLTLLIRMWWTALSVSLPIRFLRCQKALWLALLNGTLLFKLFLYLYNHMHHLLQLHLMMQLHNMSCITIKAIHKSSHSSLHVLLNISSNHNKFHLLEVLINDLCTLTRTL